MIRFKSLVAVLCVGAVFAFVACKSTPQEEPPAAEETVEEPAEEPQEEPAEPQSYSDANAALLAKVEESRKSAMDAGAASANAAAFNAAEAEFASVKAAVSSGSSDDLSAALKDLDGRYKALAAIANAKKKKDRIDSLGYASYDQASYNEGSKTLEELTSPDAAVSFGSGLLNKASSAEAAFDKVLDAAFRSLARDERNKAFAAKKDADSVKAAVSRKDEYNKGVDSFKRGDSQYVTGDPEGSLKSYTSAKDVFVKLYSEISEARAKAQAAIEAAKARVSQSEEVAVEADRAAPLGDEEVEGIEDEDSTLLEADDFTEVESAAAELEESVEETVEDNAGEEA